MEQTTRKSNKKKLIVALSLVALVVVASVITTVVLVLAAGQQQFQSNVTVTYSVTDVSAKITGRYAVKGASLGETEEDAANLMSNSPVTVNPTDSTIDAMSPAAVALSSTNDYVIFEYKFENNTYSATTQTSANPFTIALTYTDDAVGETNKDTNAALLFTSSTEKLSAFDADDVTSWTETFTTATCTNVTYVYARVAVINKSAPASFSGKFNFVLASVGTQN